MWYEELKELRLAVGMPAKELAEKVGKSPTYISRIESGAILNTSFDLVSSIASVIAETEAVRSGKVDLSKYSSDFSKLVLSYRYEDMKDVYDYAKENKDVEKYSNIIRYLNKGDIDVFEAIARYRIAESKFNDTREDFKRAILKGKKGKSFKDVIKDVRKQGYDMILDFKVPVQCIMEGSYSDFMSLAAEEMEYKIGLVNTQGMEGLLEMMYYGQIPDEDEEEIEIELPEPE